MNFLIRTSLIAFIIVLSACEKDYRNVGVDIKELDFKTYEEAKAVIGNYADFLKYYKSGISTETDFSYFSDPQDLRNVIRTNKCSISAFVETTNQIQKDRGTIYINEKEFKYDNTTKQYAPLINKDFCGDLNNLYGKTNRLKLIEPNGNIVFDEEFYFPMQFKKLEQGEKNVDEQKRTVINDSFKIFWNKDEKNSNGVMFVLDWDGYIKGNEVVGRQTKNEPIHRALWTPNDIGEATIDKKFLRDIPKGAVFTLHLYRGAGKNIQVKFSDNKIENFNLHNKITTRWQYVKQ